MDGLTSPEGFIYLFIGILIVSTAGSFFGLLTRNIIILISIGTLVLSFLFFHAYLPLPEGVQAEIFLLKARIGL